MRREDKAVTDPAELTSIIDRAPYCVVSMSDGDDPYGVPMCFGHDNGWIYCHCAVEGKKLEIIRRRPRVWVLFVADPEIRTGTSPCRWTMAYDSVMGWGEAEVLDNEAARRRGLDAVCAHYKGSAPDEGYPPGAFEKTAVIRIRLDGLTGKRSRPPATPSGSAPPPGPTGPADQVE
jgi:uncharacterized protein